MNFAHPQALYFILPLIFAVLGLALYARGRQRRAAAAFADAAMSPRILPQPSPARFWCKLALWEAGLVLSLLAIARPQWGEVVEEVKVKGSDLYVLIDVSRSMLATDVPPSRLDRAKADVSGLLSRLKGERVGLIAFAGRAAIACPLTSDYPFFRARLNELGPNSVDRGGTLIGDAIRKALSVLPEAPDRDQALLLITDGDDQESDPLYAAAVAAERHIAVFTVGLGDPSEGARVPEKDGKGRFMSYEGKEVVSRMDDELLRKIALQTGGAYVPARTSAYDLGKLYEEKLSQLRGDYAKEQKRKRMAERFEIPLAFALICFILERLIRPYSRNAENARDENSKGRKRNAMKTAAAMILLGATLASGAWAGDAHQLVNEGLKLYEKKDYAGASEKFNAAESAVPEADRETAARTAFDAGCAYQRKGDVEKATEAYKKAALARDKTLAASAQYNLGDLSASAAKELAGAQPETVPKEKRDEILEKLLTAVRHYRSSLEIQPEYPGSRKNIELVRQWIKLYTNKWAQLDRQKRREELNLLQYLEFLAATERELRGASLGAGEYASADDYAELKRTQDELNEEIEPLKEKIEKDTMTLGKYMDSSMGKPQAAPDPEQEKQRLEAVKRLQAIADAAGGKMRAAADSLGAQNADEAAASQKEAATSLDQLWEGISPFMGLAERSLREETHIVDALKASEEKKESEKKETPPADKKDEKTAASDKKAAADEKLKESRETANLADLQAGVVRRTMQLKFRAAAELAELEKNAPKSSDKPKEPEKQKEWITLDDVKREEAKKKAEEEAKKREGELKKNSPADPKTGEKEKEADAPLTPEEVKKGLDKAIELVPKAVEKMNSALEHLKKEERAAALPHAEEAKKILQEIIDAQPKRKNQDQKQEEQKQQDKNKQDQQKKDEQKKQDEKKQDEKKSEEEKKKEEEQKKEQEKKDQQKKDEQGKEDKDKQEKQEKSGQKQPMTKEQAEAMLRKVRERELDHRKQKMEELDAKSGKLRSVEKDW